MVPDDQSCPSDRDSWSRGIPDAVPQLTHSQYSLELNHRRERVGHLWQNRFYSCPLGSDALACGDALRGSEPGSGRDERGGLGLAMVQRAGHASQTCDELLDWPWLDWMAEARLGTWNYADWRARLLAAGSPEDLDRVRRCTRLGEPLGSDEFVADLEAKAGRRLRVLGRGRPYPGKPEGAAAGI